MKPNNEGWEKRFDDIFRDGLYLDGMRDYENNQDLNEQETFQYLKSFISQELTKQRERLIQEFEGKNFCEKCGGKKLKDEHCNCVDCMCNCTAIEVIKNHHE